MVLTKELVALRHTKYTVAYIYIYIYMYKGKLIPLQARCGPEGG